MSASRRAQFVPIGMTTVCWKNAAITLDKYVANKIGMIWNYILQSMRNLYQELYICNYLYCLFLEKQRCIMILSRDFNWVWGKEVQSVAKSCFNSIIFWEYLELRVSIRSFEFFRIHDEWISQREEHVLW